MKNTYPTFKNHAAAKCFKCESTMDGTPTSSGYGRGAYQMFCGKCRMWTWYDVAPDRVEVFKLVMKALA